MNGTGSGNCGRASSRRLLGATQNALRPGKCFLGRLGAGTRQRDAIPVRGEAELVEMDVRGHQRLSSGRGIGGQKAVQTTDHLERSTYAAGDHRQVLRRISHATELPGPAGPMFPLGIELTELPCRHPVGCATGREVYSPDQFAPPLYPLVATQSGFITRSIRRV